MNLKEKQTKLESILSHMGSVVVAYSGGVDSALLLAVATKVLGSRVVAATGESDSLPSREMEQAKMLALELGVEHKIIPTHEMESENYLSNPQNRCYHCKTELYGQLRTIADDLKFKNIVNGINLDDMEDYRPGILAAKEANVCSPLRDAGFNKQDIRDLARLIELPMWGKPAAACLSSRVPFGQPITPEKLQMIEEAEDYLISFNFSQVRVRHHGDIARIELPSEEIPRLFSEKISDKIGLKFKKLGFKFVTIDIQGYRSGSFNPSPLNKNG
jgi:pyridinium-3,5-biscarboxylic acid mononucleotide sulfurtransferase